MQGRTPFGGVDGLAVEQGAQRTGHTAIACELQQRIARTGIHALAREAGVEATDAQRAGLRPRRIGGDEVGDARLGEARGMRRQRGVDPLRRRRHQAACAGMASLVWVIRFCRST